MRDYPEYIMWSLRQSRGLDYTDTSDDDFIRQMEPDHAFSEVCRWKGFLGDWWKTIKGWYEGIYKAEQNPQEDNAALLALADMVDQFAYETKFKGQDAICDGGLSALERAFGVLEDRGCKMNSNGTIHRKNILKFMDELEAATD